MDKPVSTKEYSLGIAEYVSKTKGFSAVLKQQYPDFHVNEIDTNGNVVHLTNRDLPEDVKAKGQEVTDEEMSVLTVHQWNTIYGTVLLSEEKEEFCINVTKKTKREREAMRQVLMHKYSSITSKLEPRKGKIFLTISKREGEVDVCRFSDKYTQFVMYKEMFSTKGALQLLAEKTGLKLSCFSVAGNKDVKAITSQLVTVKGIEPRRLLAAVRKQAKVCVGNFSFKDSPLELGHLKGNRFRIVLRNVIGEVKDIEESLHSLKENGFINYYGAQRFGIRHVAGHHLGNQLLLGKWQEAIDLILEPSENPEHNVMQRDLYMARVEYKTSRNAQKAFELINKNTFTAEAKILKALSTNTKNLQSAIDPIPCDLRLIFLNAYQNFIWNSVASKRFSTFGFKPMVGDLVYAADSDGEDAAWFPEVDVIDATYLELDDNDGENSTETDPNNNNRQVQRNERKVIEITDANMDKYTIYDVLLPMPGYDVKYPSNEVGDWYGELLQADGLTFDSFKQQAIKSCNLRGSYRLIMAKPQDLKWRFVRYNDPMKNLVPSDLELMKNVKQPDAEVEDGTYLGLLLEFSLPSSCHVTMALREITKMDMSSQPQSSTSSAGVVTNSANNEAEGEPVFKKLKIAQDFNEVKIAPDFKEVKFEPCLNKIKN